MRSPATPLKFDDRDAALALLRWYVEMGADEAIADEPANRFAPTPAVAAPIRPSAPRRASRSARSRQLRRRP